MHFLLRSVGFSIRHDAWANVIRVTEVRMSDWIWDVESGEAKDFLRENKANMWCICCICNLTCQQPRWHRDCPKEKAQPRVLGSLVTSEFSPQRHRDAVRSLQVHSSRCSQFFVVCYLRMMDSCGRPGLYAEPPDGGNHSGAAVGRMPSAVSMCRR